MTDRWRRITREKRKRQAGSEEDTEGTCHSSRCCGRWIPPSLWAGSLKWRCGASVINRPPGQFPGTNGKPIEKLNELIASIDQIARACLTHSDRG